LEQPVIIYYGTEAGMTHNKPVVINKPFSDLQARHPMDWQNPNTEVFNFYRKLIKNRNKNGFL
jgi:glycosidase